MLDSLCGQQSIDGEARQIIRGGEADVMLAGGAQYDSPIWNDGLCLLTAMSTSNKVNHVSRWHTPMLVVHGELDYRIPDTQGIGAFTALQRRGIESRFCHSRTRTTGCSSRPTASSRTTPCSTGWMRTSRRAAARAPRHPSRASFAQLAAPRSAALPAPAPRRAPPARWTDRRRRTRGGCGRALVVGTREPQGHLEIRAPGAGRGRRFASPASAAGTTARSVFRLAELVSRLP